MVGSLLFRCEVTQATPNILSASRIALCLPLLLVDAMTVPFWVLYVIAGTTDIIDGFLARRWGVESQFGARLDSMADFVFVIAVGYKLFPWLKLPAALWMMIGLIALVKIVNAVSAYIVKHKMVFLHTKANKLTGFLLFIGIMAIGQSYFVPVAWVVACIALFAAIQEIFIRNFLHRQTIKQNKKYGKRSQVLSELRNATDR